VTDPSPRTGVAPWRRMASLGVALLGVLLVVVPAFKDRPSKIEVTYHLGAGRAGLETLKASYHSSSEEVALRVTFDYGNRRAPEEQVHSVRLPDGDYRIHLELVYRAAPPPSLRSAARSQPGGRSLVLLSRPLIVHGDGAAKVFLLDDPV
jgi:hypothetical protein